MSATEGKYSSLDSYPGEFTKLPPKGACKIAYSDHANYTDDHGIKRCWTCDSDLRTSEGDK